MAVVIGSLAMICAGIGSRIGIALAQSRYNRRALSTLPNGNDLEWWYVEMPFTVASAVVLMCVLGALMSTCVKRDTHSAVTAVGATLLLLFGWVFHFYFMIGGSFEYFP